MNKDRDYYNKILGLRTGASPAEIKSAYRRLVKLYHPDREQSPDTEIMYSEIRIAYEKLLDLHLHSEMDADPTSSNKTPKQASRASDKNRVHSKQTARVSEDRTAEYNVAGDRISFESKVHSTIFISSLKGMSISDCFTGVLALIFACIPCFDQSYSKLAVSYHIVSWILFVYFRYYFAPSTWPFFMQAVAAIMYGLVLFSLITCFYSEPERSNGLFFTCFWAAFSVWIIMIETPPNGMWRRM
jgi:hypothetical protein